MKIEFKQSFQEDGKEYKIKYKGKAEQADVPAYFVFLATFFALLKSGLIKILEIEKDEFENMPEEYKGHEERLSEEDELVLRDAIESAEFKGEESEEDEGVEDDKEPSTTSESSDSSVESSEAKPASEQTEGEQNPPTEEVKDESSELKKEYEELHEKAKRLNNKEKKRYAELKELLNIEG